MFVAAADGCKLQEFRANCFELQVPTMNAKIAKGQLTFNLGGCVDCGLHLLHGDMAHIHLGW